ncbi:LamG domain-containing protein [Rathayibacter sp. SD072]|uniref:LamG domain-containing protein n=1 Tax=Rathayibacter sp. SD072 TaxID=2781731 RepID=UPI001A9673D1|nr:LamG domain-containing protein [Rathayibacter sp. SD072]MBO0983937.1 LamG domain-containing protein [Rathayibacter sp. SD072]
MAIYQRIAQSLPTNASDRVSVAFDQPNPVDNTHTLVAVLQYAGTVAPTQTSWPVSHTSTTSSNTLAIFVTRGDGAKNGFTAIFGASQAQVAVTLFAFEGFSLPAMGQPTTGLDSFAISTTSSGTTATAGPLASPGTIATNTIAIAAVALTGGGGGTAVDAWGQWSDGFETVPLSQSRLHIGLKALTSPGQTPQSTITWTSSRVSKDAMYVIRGVKAKVNIPPTLTLDSDLTVPAGEEFLVGAHAEDPDGTISSYRWTVESADTAPILTNADQRVVTVQTTAPSTVILRCTVTDSGSALASATMTAHVTAVEDLNVRKGEQVIGRRFIGSQEVQQRIYQGEVLFDRSLVAEWNFEESDTGPFRATNGGLPLEQGSISGDVTTTASPWGRAAVFDGRYSFLRLRAEHQGVLNLGATSDQVTIAAWVWREDANTGYVAGAWQEDNNDPRRSYGLFYDLGMYGGGNRSCFHVSLTGGPTPGYTYSRDYSASGQLVPIGSWHLHVGTFDGVEARSYLDGAFEAIPSFKDNQGQTYSKNPYSFPYELNSTPCEFTVGAVRLTTGPGNYMQGRLAKLRVWDRALSATEIAAIYAEEALSL